MEAQSVTTRELLQYYAGFIDGEAYIGIKKESLRGRSKNPGYSEKVSVAGTNEMVIKSFNELWPGTLHYHRPGKNSRSPYWSWELSNKKAREFLKLIRPYLRVKGLDADIVLALGREKEKTKSRFLTSGDISIRNDLYSVLKAHRRILWVK